MLRVPVQATKRSGFSLEIKCCDNLALEFEQFGALNLGAQTQRHVLFRLFFIFLTKKIYQRGTHMQFLKILKFLKNLIHQNMHFSVQRT